MHGLNCYSLAKFDFNFGTECAHYWILLQILTDKIKPVLVAVDTNFYPVSANFISFILYIHDQTFLSQTFHFCCFVQHFEVRTQFITLGTQPSLHLERGLET